VYYYIKLKIIFLSFSFEYIQVLNNNDLSLNSNLPIQLMLLVMETFNLSFLVDNIALFKKLNLTKAKWVDKPKEFLVSLLLKNKNLFK